MIDGLDTFGGQVSPINDVISIVLPPGTNATGANFGEWGWMPDFARNGSLIVRPPVSELLVALDNTGAQHWYCGNPWGAQFDSVSTRLNSNGTILTVTVRNGTQTFTTDVVTVNNPRVQLLGVRPEGRILRLIGSPADFGFTARAQNPDAVDAAFA